MSYVDVLLDRDTDRIHVVERVNGQRVYNSYAAKYEFYYDDPRGKFQTIYRTPVSRFHTNSGREFQKEKRLRSGTRLWESDINPVFRCLAENYINQNAPDLHVAFFDIESDFDPSRGFAPTADPFNRITAITVYLQWLDQLVTLALLPKQMSKDIAKSIANRFENTYVFDSEEEMLDTFLELINDVDVLSGWNSEGYDIPYSINRITRVLSKDDTRRFCLWGQYPKQRTFERFGAEHITFDLIGRVHVDYMQLYRKYTYEERHSYSLDAIGEYELNERKVVYEGSLDKLYNEDFEKFIQYNRQDVALLAKLDNKLKFLSLANQLAHENTVLIPTTMGAVAVTEQAIINHAHSKGLVVPDRKHTNQNSQAAGAYVAHPKPGMHEWIGAIDINSLYPSTIRALNMGPETVVGQLRPTMTDALIAERTASGMTFAEAWEGLFATLEYTAVLERKPGVMITIDWEPNGSDTMAAADVYDVIFKSDQPWCISANGTIFSYERKGIIPDLLEFWYDERQKLQAKKKEAAQIQKLKIKVPNNIIEKLDPTLVN